jgi:predicted DNA-binding transcriptional regulator AlpA
MQDLLDRLTVCQRLGGSKPIDPATLYRGIKAGRYPSPIKIGPNPSRWVAKEVEACLSKMVEARHG